MTELAFTRIFSSSCLPLRVLAISTRVGECERSSHLCVPVSTAPPPAPRGASLFHAICTILAVFVLVRLRVGLNYSPANLALMLTIYALAAVPFFTGGLVITLAIARFSSRINAVYAADLLGAAAGCLVLIPLLNLLGAPGVVLTAASLAAIAAVLFAAPGRRLRFAAAAAAVMMVPLAGQLSGLAGFDIVDTKGHQGDKILFSKWNSFSRIGVYEREHGDWSLSPTYTGALPETRFMDIDSAASTPILRITPDLANAQHLRYELTALAYHLKEQGAGVRDQESGISQEPEVKGRGPGRGQGQLTALVIGLRRTRLVSALVFGASSVDAVEINPIIANDVMRDRFKDFSGGIYTHPRVHVFVDDGRSFVRRSEARYDIIQASLVDTWAATAAGAYTLTENTLYTVEAFDDYLDHLTDDGVLTITRWVFDGLRLVSLAQAACEARGWDSASRSRSSSRSGPHSVEESHLPRPRWPVSRGRRRAPLQRALCASVPPDPAAALAAAGPTTHGRVD